VDTSRINYAKRMYLAHRLVRIQQEISPKFRDKKLSRERLAVLTVVLWWEIDRDEPVRTCQVARELKTSEPNASKLLVPLGPGEPEEPGLGLLVRHGHGSLAKWSLSVFGRAMMLDLAAKLGGS
jgi:hypothetical protein